MGTQGTQEDKGEQTQEQHLSRAIKTVRIKHKDRKWKVKYDTWGWIYQNKTGNTYTKNPNHDTPSNPVDLLHVFCLTNMAVTFVEF